MEIKQLHRDELDEKVRCLGAVTAVLGDCDGV